MRGKSIFGVVLIVIGIIFLLQTFDLVNGIWTYVWPIFVLIPGILFHIGYFVGGRKQPGLLVPGGLFLVVGGLFFYHTLTGWDSSAETWPVYLYAVAFGLFELFLFGEREFGLLIPIFILVGIGTAFYFDIAYFFNMVLPIGLILIGLHMLFGKKQRGRTVKKSF